MRSLFRSMALLGAALICSVSANAAASSWSNDVAADWSSSNPSGPWSYGIVDAGQTNFTLMQQYADSWCGAYFNTTTACWKPVNVSEPVPAVTKVTTKKPVHFHNDCHRCDTIWTIPENTVLLRNHWDGRQAAVMYTIQKSGFRAITGFVQEVDRDMSQGGTLMIYIDGVLVQQKTITGFKGDDPVAHFEFVRHNWVAGQTVMWTWMSANQFYFDTPALTIHAWR